MSQNVIVFGFAVKVCVRVYSMFPGQEMIVLFFLMAFPSALKVKQSLM